mgnify:FL=1
MGLSVTEKQEIKSLIEERFDREIERIQTENKAAMDNIKQQAITQTIAALNVTDQMSELQSINAQILELNEEKKKLEERIVVEIGAENHKNLYYARAMDSLIDSKIESASRPYEKKLLSEHPLLSKIVTLRQEKDSLLQSVWIATSSLQVKQLFEMVNKLLQSTPTELETMAQSIPPDTTV